MDNIKFEIKKKEDYSKDAQKIFGFLTIFGSQNVVGSAAVKDLEYFSDYDILEAVKFEKTEDVYNDIWELFKEKFRTAYLNPDLWITDFKCGVLPGGQPIRWNRENIQTGHQIIEEVCYKFVDCLQMKSRIKLDVVAKVDGYFSAFEEIYLICVGRHTNFNKEEWTKENLAATIWDNMREEQKNGNYLKALKRLFSYLRITHKEPDLQEQLINLFNSEIGELSTYRNDLEIILKLLDQNFRKVNVEDINNNLKLIENRSPEFLKKEIKKTQNTKKKQQKITEIITFLGEKINSEVKKYIIQNKNISHYIKLE